MQNQNITQRRGTSHGSAPVSKASLPLASDDVEEGRGDRNEKRTRRRRSPWWKDPTSPIASLAGALIIVVLLSVTIVISLHSHVSQRNHHGDDDRFYNAATKTGGTSGEMTGRTKQKRSLASSDGRVETRKPLDNFASMSYALKNSDIVALYFAASWCGMSTPVTEALDAAFGEGRDGVLLMPPDGSGEAVDGRKHLSIVYVSSDGTLDEFRGYARKHWIAVPFESEDKSRLKQHFSTCAHIEVEELGIDRKHEIPTLIIIDSVTQGIITTDGVGDLNKWGDKALDHWESLQTKIHHTVNMLKRTS